MTHGLLSKFVISQGIGIVCFNIMLFHVFAGFLTQVFLNNTL